MMSLTTIHFTIGLAWVITGVVGQFILKNICSQFSLRAYIAIVGPIAHRSFYHSVGLWCWISNVYPYAQLFMRESHGDRTLLS